MPQPLDTGTRAFLAVVGVFFLLAGSAYLIEPAALAHLVGMQLDAATAVIEVQGFYGGQMIGLGAFTLLGARDGRYAAAALLLVAADLGGTAVGRAAGMVLAGELPPIMAGLLVVETASAAAALALLRLARRRRTDVL